MHDGRPLLGRVGGIVGRLTDLACRSIRREAGDLLRQLPLYHLKRLVRGQGSYYHGSHDMVCEMGTHVRRIRSQGLDEGLLSLI